MATANRTRHATLARRSIASPVTTDARRAIHEPPTIPAPLPPHVEMKRRDFFKIVATTGAAAAAGGCQQATETILPLVVPNEQLVPGVAAWFATVCREWPARFRVSAANPHGAVL